MNAIEKFREFLKCHLQKAWDGIETDHIINVDGNDEFAIYTASVKNPVLPHGVLAVRKNSSFFT